MLTMQIKWKNIFMNRFIHFLLIRVDLLQKEVQHWEEQEMVRNFQEIKTGVRKVYSCCTQKQNITDI